MRLFVDTLAEPSTIIPAVEGALRRRVDGVLVPVSWPGAAPKAKWVHDSGRAVLAYWEDLTADEVTGTREDGLAAGRAAIDAAVAAGLPPSLIPAVGIEEAWNPSSEFICGLADAGIRVLYGSPESAGLQNGLAAARAADPAAEQLSLWSAAWRGAGAAPPSIPEWAPPTCAGAGVLAWQWWGNWKTKAGPVDLDFVHDAWTAWEGLAAGEFTDVPADAWYAADVAQAAREGLMEGVAPGRFEPDGVLTRAQAATLVVRTLAASRVRVSASTASLRKFGHPTDGYGFRRGPRRISVALAAAPVPLPSVPVLVPGIADLPTVNQEQTPQCVEWSGALAHLWLQRHLGRQNPQLPSPSWGYGETHPGGNGAPGTDPAALWPIIERLGWCPMSDDPFPPGGDQTALGAWQSVTPATVAAARPYRISGCKSVAPDPGSIVAALADGPVMVDGPVAQSFESPQAMRLSGASYLIAALGQPSISGVLPASWTDGAWLGEHQYLVVGYVPTAPYLPEPLSEGVPGYLVCLTTWGGWVPGKAPLFLVPTTYPLYEAWQLTGLAAAPSGACAELADFLHWLEADAATVLDRLKENFIGGGADEATATAKAQAALDAQKAALTAKMQAEGC